MNGISLNTPGRMVKFVDGKGDGNGSELEMVVSCVIIFSPWSR